MGLIYADLTSPTDIDTLVANLVAGMLAKKGPGFLHRPEEAVLNEIFKREANKIASSERATPTPPDRRGAAGLTSYLQARPQPVLQSGARSPTSSPSSTATRTSRSSTG